MALASLPPCLGEFAVCRIGFPLGLRMGALHLGEPVLQRFPFGEQRRAVMLGIDARRLGSTASLDEPRFEFGPRCAEGGDFPAQGSIQRGEGLLRLVQPAMQFSLCRHHLSMADLAFAKLPPCIGKFRVRRVGHPPRVGEGAIHPGKLALQLIPLRDERRVIHCDRCVCHRGTVRDGAHPRHLVEAAQRFLMVGEAALHPDLQRFKSLALLRCLPLRLRELVQEIVPLRRERGVFCDGVPLPFGKIFLRIREPPVQRVPLRGKCGVPFIGGQVCRGERASGLGELALQFIALGKNRAVLLGGPAVLGRDAMRLGDPGLRLGKPTLKFILRNRERRVLHASRAAHLRERVLRLGEPALQFIALGKNRAVLLRGPTVFGRAALRRGEPSLRLGKTALQFILRGRELRVLLAGPAARLRQRVLGRGEPALKFIARRSDPRERIRGGLAHLRQRALRLSEPRFESALRRGELGVLLLRRLPRVRERLHDAGQTVLHLRLFRGELRMPRLRSVRSLRHFRTHGGELVFQISLRSAQRGDVRIQRGPLRKQPGNLHAQ